jgi:hypothetical protein
MNFPFIIYRDLPNALMAMSHNKQIDKMLLTLTKASIDLIDLKQDRTFIMTLEHEFLHYIMHSYGIGKETTSNGDADTQETCEKQFDVYLTIIQSLYDSADTDPNILTLVDILIDKKSFLIAKFEQDYKKKAAQLNQTVTIQFTKNSHVLLKRNFIKSRMAIELRRLAVYKKKNESICGEFLCNTGYTEMISGIKSNFDPRHLQRLHNENIQMGSTTEIIKVNTKKLDTIFDENNISHINYLSIDVEGASESENEKVH